MPDVFISYSTKNQAQADHIRQTLEDAGISCWYAPLSLRGAQNFTKEIPEAIAASKAFLLLMSEDAQNSKWVQRELGEADDDEVNLPIFTFFLEECTLNKDFRFMLRFSQHYPIGLGFSEQMTRLLRDLQKILTQTVRIPLLRPLPPLARKKSRLPLILGAAAVVVALAVAAAFFLLGGGLRDGSYVIWNPEYAIALSSDVANSYYHAGEQVGRQGDILSSYSQKCVWELDFGKDNTLTIRCDGLLLGMVPGYTGIGLGSDYPANQWELVEAGDDLYYIRNIETGHYLEWYKDKGNWSAYDTISADKRELFQVRIDPAK